MCSRTFIFLSTFSLTIDHHSAAATLVSFALSFVFITHADLITILNQLESISLMYKRLKTSMDASRAHHHNARQCASEFLLRYRVTLHATTGSSQDHLFKGRFPMNELDLIHQNL